MSHLLAIDVGKRRTGVAHANPADSIALPLPTITHTTADELRHRLMQLVQQYGITEIVVGLPLLPSGQEGAQAQWTREMVEELTLPSSLSLGFLDERYTTPRVQSNDPDSEAAVILLDTYLAQRKFDK